MLRSWSLLGVLAVLGCTPLPSPSVPSCDPALENCGCVADVDCGDPTLFFCDTLAQFCRPTCTTSLGCNTRPVPLAECAGPLGCWCDVRTCVTAQCSDDSQCGGLACRNGACVTPPTDAARCTVTPELAVLIPGAHVRFHVLASDAHGEPVVIPGGAMV